MRSMHWHKRGKTTSRRNRDPALVRSDGCKKEGRSTMTYIHIVGVRMNPWAWKGCYLRSTVLRFPTCLNTLKSIIYVDDMGFGEPILFQLMEIRFFPRSNFYYELWKRDRKVLFFIMNKKVFEDFVLLFHYSITRSRFLSGNKISFCYKNKIFIWKNGIIIRE